MNEIFPLIRYSVIRPFSTVASISFIYSDFMPQTDSDACRTVFAAASSQLLSDWAVTSITLSIVKIASPHLSASEVRNEQAKAHVRAMH